MPERRANNAFQLLEREIRYAMENSQSNLGAARFLNISYITYKKYAKIYKDEETGINLFELHKNQAGKKIAKGTVHQKGYYKLEDILEGFHPDYSPNKLKVRLINSGLLEERCARCGFDERRILDYKVPLLLDWIDGNTHNHRRDNLQFLCFNCYYLTVDNVVGKKLVVKF